jgi:hypothetical protein
LIRIVIQRIPESRFVDRQQFQIEKQLGAIDDVFDPPTGHVAECIGTGRLGFQEITGGDAAGTQSEFERGTEHPVVGQCGANYGNHLLFAIWNPVNAGDDQRLRKMTDWIDKRGDFFRYQLFVDAVQFVRPHPA